MNVLQQGVGPYEPHLDLVAPLNAAKCRAHGHHYRAIRTQRLKGAYKPHEKYLWMLEALHEDNTMWLDADAWLCGDENQDQLGDADVAGVKNGDGEINTGVIWFRRSAKVIAFLKSLLETMKYAVQARGAYSEQWHTNVRLPFSGLKVKVLDGRWNAYRNATRPTEPVQIWTFHSTQASPSQKLRQMSKAILKGAA